MGFKVGYKDDDIFLLSAEEYEFYKDKIPQKKFYWWTRTEGKKQSAVASITDEGNVNYDGYHVDSDYNFVRPTIRFPQKPVYDYIYMYGYTWFIIDDGIAIAEMPIGVEVFDEKSNDYENSSIRKWLLDWIDERE